MTRRGESLRPEALPGTLTRVSLLAQPTTAARADVVALRRLDAVTPSVLVAQLMGGNADMRRGMSTASRLASCVAFRSGGEWVDHQGISSNMRTTAGKYGHDERFDDV